MSRLRWLPGTLLALLALSCLLACSGCSESKGLENETPVSQEDEGPFVLGDLIEEKDFAPPTLEELDAQVEWIDNDIVDAIERLRERQADEEVQATVEQALSKRNNSDRNNERILSAMGRLPENEEQVDWEASIRRHSGADVKSTNPLFMSSTAEFEVVDLLGIGLVGFDWDFETFGSKDTVKSWQSSSDGLYDKFVLRDDLFWSDGVPVTAHDFVFGYQVVMSSQVPVTSRTSEMELRWVEAYDDQTLVIFHKKPLATNRWNCSVTAVPKHIYEDSIADDPSLQNSDHHVHYEQNPVVAGPYEIARREQGTEIVLRAREDYYMQGGVQVRGRPHFQTLIFRTIVDPNTSLLALKSGDIEELGLTAEQWISQTDDNEFYGSNTKVREVEWTSFHFCWNTQSRFFSDSRVRWAMTYAFDHQEMLETIFFDLYEPCRGVFHPASKWAPDELPPLVERDLDKAEELLEQAGWYDHNGDGILDKKIDGRSTRFEFTILSSPSPNSIAICILLKQSLADIGIICNIAPTEFTVLQQKTRDHAFHATIGGWGTGADPYTLQNIFGTDEDRNFGEYSNEDVDRLFEEGLLELDPEKRVAVYQQIHEQLWDDQPYTWLFNPSGFHAFNKGLRGYVFSPRGPYSYGPGFYSIWKPARL